MSSPSDRPGDEATPAPGGGEGRGTGAPEESEDARDEHPGSNALAWRGARYFAYGVGGVLLTALLLVGLVLLLVQTEWGSRVAKNVLLAQVNPLGTEAHEARLEIDDIDGNWLGGLELKGVRLVRPRRSARDTTGAGAAGAALRDSARGPLTMVQIDSLKAGYRLLSLFHRRVDLDGVQVYGPDVRMTQQPDGAWDLLQTFSDTTQQDTTARPWRVRLDSVQVQGGRLDAHFYTAGGADSTLRVRALNAFASDLDFGGPSAPHLDVRTLSARFTPPGQTLERRLAFSGTLDERRLAVNALTLDSPYSNVSAKGTLVLPGAQGGPVHNIDFRLEGQPLSFRDLAGFVPRIDPSRSVRFSARAEGTSERLRATLDATFSDGATADVSGTVAPGVGGGALAYDLQGQVRRFDPGFFTPGPVTGSINGDFSADLSGTSAQELEGTLSAALFDTRFGEYLLNRTTLDARFTGDGAVALDAQGGLRGATFAAEGTLRPFADPLAYDLSGDFQNVDLGRFTQNPGQSSDLDGQISVQGYGTSLADANVTAQVALDGSRINQFSINEGRFDVRLIDGKMNLGARVRSPQGTADVKGTLRLTRDPPAYDLGGTFRNLDLARLTGNPEQSSDLNGQISVQGRGTRPAEADLTAQVALAGSRINRFTVNESRFTARLAGGTLNLDGRLRSPQGTADLRGAVQFTADPLRYHVSQGRIQNLDVAALAGDTTRSSITGTFRLQGSGTNPQQDLRLDVAGLRLTDSYYGPYVIHSTNLDAHLAGGRLDLDGQADLDGGTFDLSGATLYPFQAVPSFSVESASFANVDIGTLGQYPGAGVQQSSDLSGTVTLEGRGFQPQTMTLSGTARLSDSRLNDQQINSAVVEIHLSDGLLAFDGALDVPQGQTQIAGTVRPFSENPTFALNEGSTFAGIDVGALAGIEGLHTNLRGRILALEGTGFSLNELRGNARVDLTGSTINDATVASGTLDLDTEGGAAHLLADLQFEDGGRTNLDVRLAGRRTAGPLTYRATGTVDSLDVGRLLGEAAAGQAAAGQAAAGQAAADTTGGGLLTLRLDVQGTGTDPRTATSRGRLDVASAHFSDIDVRRLTLDYRLHAGRLTVDTLALHSNVADATGSGVLALYDPQRRYATDFRFTAAVDSLGPVRPFLSDSLRALAMGENSFAGRLTGRPGGPLRLTSDVHVESLIYNDVRLSNFDGTVSAATTAARDSAGAGGVLVALRTLSIETLENARVRGDAGYLATSTFSTRQAHVDAIYDGDAVDLKARVKVDQERDIELAGVLDPRPGRQRLRLDTLNVRFGPDRWKLLQDATITYGDAYRISNLLLYTDDGQQIAVDGVIDFDGQQSLVVTVEDFRIGAVAGLLGYENLGGTAGGALTLSGPAQSPQLTGRLTLDVASGGERVGDLQLALDYAGERLGVDATLMHEDQSALTAEGYLPLDLRLSRPGAPDSLAAAADSAARDEKSSPIDIVEISADTLSADEVALAVRADSFAVAWARPFLDADQVEDLGGRLTADITVGGTLAAPRLEGTAALTEGALELASLGTTYHDIRAQARFTGDQVQLHDATMKSGGGTLTAQGTMNLKALTLGELDIGIEAEDFRVVDTDEYRATASADLQLQGTTDAPVLRGDVNVRDADLYLDAFGDRGDYGEADLTEEDLQALRENFGVRITEGDTTRSQAYQALAMQLDVSIKRDTWLRSTSNPELAVQLEGDIDLQKEAQQDLQLFGSIEVDPERSRVVQFGKRFDIASGVVTFNGAPGQPLLDFDAEYHVAARRSRGDEVTITLSVSGRPDDLDFELGSTPSMETTDILSYIATGKPASESFVGGGSGGATGVATGVALGQLTNLVEGLAGDQGLGLDIIEIEQDPLRGTVLTAGEYIYIEAVPNPLFIAVSQPISGTPDGTSEYANATEVTLEYEVTSGLLVRLLRRQSIRLNLRFEYAY